MTLTESIIEIINPITFINFNNSDDSIVVDEPKNLENKQLKSIKINGIQEVYAAIKLDLENVPFTGRLINEGKYKKACDAILFCKVNNKDYIFIIELKSNELNLNEVIQKFRNAKCFIEYLRVILKCYHNIDIPDIDNNKIISLLFDRKLTRKPTIVDKNGEKFKHQGFGNPNNEVDIRRFIN
jgi:hypothetical protein